MILHLAGFRSGEILKFHLEHCANISPVTGLLRYTEVAGISSQDINRLQDELRFYHQDYCRIRQERCTL
jgi:hypothetical protein